jgi:hypothetical protein
MFDFFCSEQRHQRVREDFEVEPRNHHGRPLHPRTHRRPPQKYQDTSKLKLLFLVLFIVRNYLFSPCIRI